MHYLKEWPRLLLTLPNTIRLALLILCTILCLSIHILTYPESHNGSLLLIPGCLAAWMFRKRGLLVCIGTEIAVMVVYQSIRLKSLWWPISFAVFFWGGFLVLFLVGSIIVSIRMLVDSSEMARRKAEEAERQVAMAYDQQVQFNEQKDEFLLNVSHELRTPLTVLGGSLELLKEQHEHLNPMKQTDLLALAIESYEELACFANQVLNATSVTGEFSPAKCEVVSIHQIVHEVLTHFDPQDAQAYTFHLDIPEQTMVWGDPQHLRRVLHNLLDNAFKYVPKQTEIGIKATHPDPLAPVCLCVQDAGPGIPPEELPYLFEKFVRLKRDLALATRGTGLGLYICKRLVKAMGGHIWVESSGRIGEGSRFCFTLPVYIPQCPPPGTHLLKEEDGRMQ